MHLQISSFSLLHFSQRWPQFSTSKWVHIKGATTDSSRPSEIQLKPVQEKKKKRKASYVTSSLFHVPNPSTNLYLGLVALIYTLPGVLNRNQGWVIGHLDQLISDSLSRQAATTDSLLPDIAVTPLDKVLEVNDGRSCLAVSQLRSAGIYRFNHGEKDGLGGWAPRVHFIQPSNTLGQMYWALLNVSPMHDFWKVILKHHWERGLHADLEYAVVVAAWLVSRRRRKWTTFQLLSTSRFVL